MVLVRPVARLINKLCASCASQSGQLNEYTERKEMSADVVCMSLANVPPGEQRSRFLAVGLVDNTVRIISLDPSVSSGSGFASCWLGAFRRELGSRVPGMSGRNNFNWCGFSAELRGSVALDPSLKQIPFFYLVLLRPGHLRDKI